MDNTNFLRILLVASSSEATLETVFFCCGLFPHHENQTFSEFFRLFKSLVEKVLMSSCECAGVYMHARVCARVQDG